MKNSPKKTKPCLKEKLQRAADLYEEVKKETKEVKEALLKEESEHNGNASKRALSFSRD